MLTVFFSQPAKLPSDTTAASAAMDRAKENAFTFAILAWIAGVKSKCPLSNAVYCLRVIVIFAGAELTPEASVAITVITFLPTRSEARNFHAVVPVAV